MRNTLTFNFSSQMETVLAKSSSQPATDQEEKQSTRKHCVLGIYRWKLWRIGIGSSIVLMAVWRFCSHMIYAYVEREREQTEVKSKQYPARWLLSCLCISITDCLALSQVSWPQDFKLAVEKILAFMQIHQPSDSRGSSAFTSYFPWKIIISCPT